MRKEYKDLKTGIIRKVPEALYNQYRETIYKNLQPLDLKETQNIVINPVPENQVDLVEAIEELEDKLEEVVNTEDEIQTIRDNYKLALGKEVSARYKNDAEYMIKKINEAQDV